MVISQGKPGDGIRVSRVAFTVHAMSIHGIFNRNAIFVTILLSACCILLLMPSLYDSPYARDEQRYIGRVLEADNARVRQFGLVKSGVQSLSVVLLDGPYAGRHIRADNILLGKMESDKVFRASDKVFVVVSTDGDKITAATAYDHYRFGTELLLLAAFALFICAMAGWSGAKALISFCFAILMMWKILLPGVMRGMDPIGIALLVTSSIAGAALFGAAGVSRTALTAWLGSLVGTALTAVLAFVLFPPFQLHGAIQPFSETLLYSGFEGLNLERLFIAAVFLGASGAVMDLSIDVSAAMGEIARKRPDLSIKELMRSGLVVGRPMAATMVTTLLMAYMSEYMALFMVLFSKGIPAVQMVNVNYVAAEVLKTVVGSFGLLAVAPLTAVAGGFIFVNWRKKECVVQVSPASDTIRDDPGYR